MSESKSLLDIIPELRSLSRCEEMRLNGTATLIQGVATVFGKPLHVYFHDLADNLEAVMKKDFALCYCGREGARVDDMIGTVARLCDAIVKIAELARAGRRCHVDGDIRKGAYLEDITHVCVNALAGITKAGAQA